MNNIQQTVNNKLASIKNIENMEYIDIKTVIDSVTQLLEADNIISNIKNNGIDSSDYDNYELILDAKSFKNGYGFVCDRNRNLSVINFLISYLPNDPKWSWDFTLSDLHYILQDVLSEAEDGNNWFEDMNLYLGCKKYYEGYMEYNSYRETYITKIQEIINKNIVECCPEYNEVVEQCNIYMENGTFPPDENGWSMIQFEYVLKEVFHSDGFVIHPTDALEREFQSHPNWNNGELTEFEAIYFGIMANEITDDLYYTTINK